MEFRGMFARTACRQLLGHSQKIFRWKWAVAKSVNEMADFAFVTMRFRSITECICVRVYIPVGLYCAPLNFAPPWWNMPGYLFTHRGNCFVRLVAYVCIDIVGMGMELWIMMNRIKSVHSEKNIKKNINF